MTQMWNTAASTLILLISQGTFINFFAYYFTILYPLRHHRTVVTIKATQFDGDYYAVTL